LAADTARRRPRPRAARLSFVPTCLPIAVKPVPAGFVQEGSARLSVTPDLKGFTWLVIDAEEGASAYVILHSLSTSERAVVPVDESSLSRLLVKFDGYPRGETRAVVNFTPVDRDAAEVGVPVRIPLSGRTCSFMVTPETYRVTVSASGSGVFVPQTLALGQGKEHTLHYGSKFEARLNVLRWGPKMLELWFDVIDDRGNCLHQVDKSTGTLRLTGSADTLYDGPGVRKSARHFKIERNWGPPESRGDVGYEYVLNSDFLGSLARRGVLPTDPKEFLPDSLPVTFASPHFEIRYRENTPEAAQRVAEALEGASSWLAQHYAGPIQVRRHDRITVRSVRPVGVGAAGGDNIGVLVYAAQVLDPRILGGTTRVLFHEYGHLYQAHPPHHQAQNMGKDTCESIASLLCDYCIRALQGEQGYRRTNQNWSKGFFNSRLANQKPEDEEDTIGEGDEAPEHGADRLDFIYHYVHMRYGQKVNRDFFRALYASEGNCEQVLFSADFLQTEVERSAALYSFLAGDNLGWLYRWAGFKVEDAKIDRALSYFKERGASIPEQAELRVQPSS